MGVTVYLHLVLRDGGVLRNSETYIIVLGRSFHGNIMYIFVQKVYMCKWSINLWELRGV